MPKCPNLNCDGSPRVLYPARSSNDYEKINFNCNESLLNHSLSWYKQNKFLEANDGLIIGVSNIDQLNKNINILNKNIISNYDFSDKIYNIIKNKSPNYYY